MSRTAHADAQISQKILEIWGTSDRTPAEELDSREVWWRDRYHQLHDHGYLLRPRYSPQWVPSWKTSNRDSEDSEDGQRLKVCKRSPCCWYLIITCRSSSAQLLMRLGRRTGEWSL